jgi:BirA family biotin operon repressor/biotin-[acetyl-CoA-carboxylase] ligase
MIMKAASRTKRTGTETRSTTKVHSHVERVSIPVHLQPQTIHAHRGLWGGRLLRFATLPSTNTWTMDHAASCRHGDVIVAETQTRGRGRFERTWLALPGKSLALSVYIEGARLEPDDIHALGPCAALAVRRTLAHRGIAARVKWPNDVLVDHKKISGILLEQSQHGIVLGIGINLALTQIELNTAGLGGTATSVFIQSGIRPKPDRFLCRLLENLMRCLEDKMPLNEWQRHDALLNQDISIATATETLQGRYEGLRSDWRLMLLDTQGRQHILSAGDVTFQRSSPPKGYGK